ncbi:MAG: HutD family protein [Alphaproteobacteria bacterium]
MIHHLKAEDFRAVPWKNGGGTATDIKVVNGPDGATDWRVGTASIDRDGPFSDYADYERTFVIIEGAGVFLDFPDGVSHDLPCDQVLVFRGGPPPGCRLKSGRATAFNLMTRVGSFTGKLSVGAPPGAAWFEGAGVIVVYALDGDVTVTIAGKSHAVAAGGAMIIEGPDAAAVAVSATRVVLAHLRSA